MFQSHPGKTPEIYDDNFVLRIVNPTKCLNIFSNKDFRLFPKAM